MKKPKFRLTDNEYNMMSLLWDSGHPMAKYEILKEAEQPYGWSDAYVKKTLHDLEQKGAVTTNGKVRVGKRFSRYYLSVMTEDEYNLSCYPVHSADLVIGLLDQIYKEVGNDEKQELTDQLQKFIDDHKDKKDN